MLADDFTLWHFFRGLIAELVAQGHTVYVMTPAGPYVPRLESIGATHVPIEFERFMSPLADLRAFFSLRREFATLRVDLVCNIMMKPIVFGGVAARLAGVKRVIGMIEGLGYSFEPAVGWSRRLLRAVVIGLLRLGCKLSDRVGFANHEDHAFFVSRRFLPPTKAVAFRSMIGVDTDEYSQRSANPFVVERVRRELDLKSGELLLTMVVARQCWSKGVREFLDAADAVGRRFPEAKFLLVGPSDPKSPEAVPDEYIEQRVGPRFQWVRFSEHIREILYLTDVMVLPSYYREGLPRVLLEALAMGKPLVTTDNVGCREAVEPGKNGLLVPVRDTAALTDAVCTVLSDGALRNRWGEHSRRMAVADFDQRDIIAKVLAMWDLASIQA